MLKHTWLHDFIDIIYPNACMGCHEPLVTNEDLICTHCLHELPKTDFHADDDNPVLRIFSGRCFLEKATSYLRFVKGGVVQSLMHQFKYKGHTEVGVMLANLASSELRKTDFFRDVDLIIPVPLHPDKLAKRGYNQSEVVAKTISENTHISLSTENLVRQYFNETQTRKSRFARWLNVKTVFAVKDEAALKNKHILLVDDVVTTGSTIEGCVTKLEHIEGVRVSLFTLAIAQ